MNFLAHLYLSPNNTDIMLGNFFADHIKGNKIKHYSDIIKKGIFLHRAIDTFTDNHEIVKISKRRLHERYGHYDGIIIDIFYDHFLAKYWDDYSQIPLDIYSNSIYKLLQQKQDILPEKTKELLPYIIKYNLFYNYKHTNTMADVLNGMDRRTKGKSQMNLAINDLEIHKTELEKDFKLFFIDLKEHVNSKIRDFN